MPDMNELNFRTQYEERLEDFISWAIENWPDKSIGPSPSSFSRCRDEAEAVLSRLPREKNARATAAEPSEGGPQYVSVTPTPWP